MSATSAQHPVFVPGQRWISDAEIELGLGTILQCDRRSVTLLFNHNGETRTYSTSTAPLTRVVFSEGDRVTHQNGWSMRVIRAESVDGLLIYIGENSEGETLELMETQLDSQIRFQGPRERLLTGQIDRNNEYMLRALSRQAQTRLAKDPMRGLRGPRVGLIPHQLYIAHEVGRRLAPRVLLADEVGLGKTIEAGLILHQQLITGRARRALILVPGSLCHQWLVELLRRFGLPVTLVDADRAQATGAPFADATIALASLNWITHDKAAREEALAEDWDLLIVDEAHHLRWSPDVSSPEYECVRQLAEFTPGLLLLTATPEQSGETGFFAQLQLLDPARYPNLDDFLAEEEGYRTCATAIARLEAQQLLEPEDLAALQERLSGDSLALLDLLDNPQSDDAQRDAARQQLTEQLLDRYGTGRVLFRNRRASVPGFPERKVFSTPLDCPDIYREILEEHQEPTKQLMAAALTGQTWPYAGLYPERLYAIQKREEGNWWDLDPRVDWLLDKLDELCDEKVLLICAHADTALELTSALRRRAGILAAVFHEDMALIERDRAAAWFADDQDGAPILICSEIGSEGRNFQFAHHLILFDLPAHPDLLEQRIGRLDRIGQTKTVNIHVPYLKDTPQEPWLAWCGEQGLDQFTHPRPVGATLWQQYQDKLFGFLEGSLATEDFLPQVQANRQAAEIELEAGRHRLLELASHRPEISGQLVEQLADDEMDKELREYLEVALDVYRIHNEDLDADTWYLKPGQESDTAIFTDVHFDMEEGSSGTFLRDKALARDDLHFLTWEHPLTRNCLEAATTTVKGNVTVALLKNQSLPAGTLLLEVFFCLENTQQNDLNLGRYLPPQSLRILLDGNANDLSSKVKFKGLSRQIVRMKKSLGREVVKLRKEQLRELLDKAEVLAEEALPSMLETAQEDMRELLDPEIARLSALLKTNSAVRNEEVEQLVELRQALDASLNAASLRLDALRVIVAGGQE